MKLPYSGAAQALLGALCALIHSAPAYAAITVESDDGEAGFELVGHARTGNSSCPFALRQMPTRNAWRAF